MSKGNKPEAPPRKDKNAAGVDAPAHPGADERSLEDDPAVERGERIATGKAIGRSGQPNGAVPGATPQDSSSQ